MTSRQTNNLLAGAAVALAIASLAIVAAGVLLPIDASNDERPTRAIKPSATNTVATSQPAGMDQLFARSFRTTLEDAPTAAAKASAAAMPVAAAAPLQVSVVGAIGDSVALLRLADGSVVARSVGDQIDGAEVVRIEAKAIAFRRDGQAFSISKPPTVDVASGDIVIR